MKLIPTVGNIEENGIFIDYVEEGSDQVIEFEFFDFKEIEANRSKIEQLKKLIPNIDKTSNYKYCLMCNTQNLDYINGNIYKCVKCESLYAATVSDDNKYDLIDQLSNILYGE